MISIHEWRYGSIYTIDADPVVSESIRIYGEWAQNEINLLRHFISPKDTVIDIGAYIGTHSIAFAQLVGHDGKVFAFEPRPVMADLVSMSAALNNIDNIIVQTYAIGADTGSIKIPQINLELSANYGAASFMKPETVSAAMPHTNVEIRPLDSFDLSGVSLIKIDVEGMEADVLQGARQTIETSPNAVIYCECNSVAAGSRILHANRKLTNMKVFGFIFTAYNKYNHRLRSFNNFGDASEAALVLVPPARMADADTLIKYGHITEIKDEDDIASLLLKQPQYMSGRDVAYQEDKGRSFDLSPRFEREPLAFGARISRRDRHLGRIRDWNPVYRYRIKAAQKNFSIVEFDSITRSTDADKGKHLNTNDVDIIIPIFNGADNLQHLLKSLTRHGWGDARLWLVDDASTDATIGNLIESFAEKHKTIRIIRNPVNLGFIGSVNKTLAQTEGHVVLLNSDTAVPGGWLERLIVPIMKDPSIGSVTPFTNSGQICSFPDFLKDNHMSCEEVDEIDRFFSALPLLAPPMTLPTAVGFCMAINKKALDQVGVLDPAFGRGYGEENDWCMRALSKGFRSVLANNLFVFHAHGGSFLPEEKQILLASNYKLLDKRHRRYRRFVHKFIESDPLKLIRNVLKFQHETAGKKVTIYLDHNFGGGANFYRNQQLRVIAKEGNGAIVYGEEKEHAFLRFVSPTTDTQLNGLKVGQLASIIKIIKPDEIIYNNLVGAAYPTDLINSVVDAQATESFKLTLLIHDFFPVCPSYTLLNYEGNYCGVPDIEECGHCLPRIPDEYSSFRPNHVSMETWRTSWGRLIERSSEIRCFSRNSADILLTAYPAASRLITVVPHIVEIPFTFSPRITQRTRPRVGVIGGINYCKGLALLQQLEKISLDHKIPVDFVIVGETDHRYPLKTSKILGRYNVKDLPAIIESEQIEMIFVPSVWPETFSYVTAEAMNLGLPVFCLPLGAPAERMKHYSKGHVASSMEPLQILKELIATRNLYVPAVSESTKM